MTDQCKREITRVEARVEAMRLEMAEARRARVEAEAAYRQQWTQK